MDKELHHTNDLIDGCKAGSRKAQEALYRSYYKTMANLCLRYTKNSEDAVEALNNGFFKVFKNIHQYQPHKANLYTWIRTIIINSCLDLIKARGKQIQAKELNETIEVDIAAEVISKMDAEEILRLVRELPPASRSVFNLYVVDGFTHKEIAGLLQISEGTSKWHLSEARKTLQRLIKKEKAGIHE